MCDCYLLFMDPMETKKTFDSNASLSGHQFSGSKMLKVTFSIGSAASAQVNVIVNKMDNLMCKYYTFAFMSVVYGIL